MSLYTPADASLALAQNASPNGRHVVATSNGGVYSSVQCGVAISQIELEPGTYLLVPSTFNPWAGTFSLAVYSNPPVSVSQLR